MKRKCLAVVIILLFTGTCTVPAIAHDMEKTSQSTSSGNWLYVGGGGSGNYTKIQDAIDNAVDGDFIYVFAGIYYENILIHKSLHLIGENAEITIIDGCELDQVVIITADLVTIERFTIRNNGINHPSGYIAGIWVDSNHITISNNIIVDNYGAGIFFTQVSDITICKNNISESDNGIWIYDSINNNITNNDIHNNYYGIRLGGSSNQIIANTIHHNYEYGISLVNGVQNNVQDNTIFSNDDVGIFLYGSNQNIIQSNTIAYNRNISISLVSSNSNVISENSIQGNDQGIKINLGHNNQIRRNNFIENQVHADFSLYAPCRFLKILVKNNWMNNYWDDHHTRLPRLISGELSYSPDPSTPWYHVSIKWIAIDWRPAKEPYDTQ